MARKMTLDAREARIAKLKAELEAAEREHDHAADAELLTAAHALGTRRALELVMAALSGQDNRPSRTAAAPDMALEPRRAAENTYGSPA